MRALSLVAALASLVSVLGCSPPPTQLIVVVDTDLAIPATLDEVRISMASARGAMGSERQPLTSADALPLTLTLVAEGDDLGPVEVVAEGYRRGVLVLARNARTMLVRGETRMLRLHLVAACVGVTCDDDQSCGESGCAAVDVVAPPWPGSPPRLSGPDAGMDGGPRVDAAIDTGPMPDAWMRCSTDAECDDGISCTADRCTDGRCVYSPDDTQCDDEEACTSNHCVVGTGCVFDPLPDAACDDGIFCNGFDRCAAGTCTVHNGDPCASPTVCDESADRCTGCRDDADCPADSVGAWSACSYDDRCDETGSRSRVNRTHACVSGSCRATDATETEPCMRDTDGASCGMGSCGSYGTCNYSDACDESATQTRTCTDLVCTEGVCRSTSHDESRPCTRDTDGVTCMPTSCGEYGSCDYSDVCDESASQSRTCTDYHCAAGSCGTSVRTETMACSRDTDGMSCGMGGQRCTAGVCTTCAPTMSGGGGTVNTSYFTAVGGVGNQLRFTDGSGPTVVTVTASSATFSGSFTSPICVWQVHGMGSSIRLVDWDGTTMGSIAVSGTSVSGTAAPPCTPGPYGCFPPCVGRITTSGSTMTVEYFGGVTANLTFGCP
ncbi:MAG: hypothetical protein OHK0013_19680 [Sandaracinaceae bacterium]